MEEKKERTITRRESIGLIAGGAGLLAMQPTLTLQAQQADSQLIAIDPTPRHRHFQWLSGRTRLRLVARQ